LGEGKGERSTVSKNGKIDGEKKASIIFSREKRGKISVSTSRPRGGKRERGHWQKKVRVGSLSSWERKEPHLEPEQKRQKEEKDLKRKRRDQALPPRKHTASA